MKKAIELLPAFRQFIIASKTGRRVTPSGKRICNSTIEQYRYTYKLVEKYEQYNGSILTIPLIHRSSVRELQKHKLYWKRFYSKFLQFMYGRGNFDRYISTILKTIKTFFNYELNEKSLPIGNFHKRFALPSENLVPVVLEPYQLKYLILNKEFHESLTKSLKIVKDIFVFGCTVGLRYSDLLSLKKENIQTTATGSFVILNTQKTGAYVKIPLPDYILEIIEKYKTKAGKYVLPRLAKENMNMQIKRVIEKAGWVYPLIKIRNRQGKPVELKTKDKKSYRFCDNITSHTMRRTAITTLLMMGVPEAMVRKISGHAPESKEFYKYVSIVQDYLNEEVLNAYNKLLGG
jgi:integrase